MDFLAITLFGQFQLRYQDRPVDSIRTSRQQGLLAYLLLHHGTPVDRGHLAFLFWPNSTDKQARSNLRTLLHRIRNRLPDAGTFIEIDRATVTWRVEAPFVLDVAEFERALCQFSASDSEDARVESLKQAVDRYGGRLLPHLYADWLNPHRDRLHASYVSVLQGLVSLHEARRNYEAAIHFGHRLLDDDLLDEDNYRSLIRLHALAGNPTRALQLYTECADLLQHELGIEPAADIQAMAERLRQRLDSAAGQPPKSTEPATPLFGRNRDWGFLTQQWQRTAGASARMALLIGEPGIGKTRLLQDFEEWVGRQGHGIVRFRCYATHTEIAYAPVVDWFRAHDPHQLSARLDEPWLVELSRLLPGLRLIAPDLPEPRPLTAAWQRQRLYAALTEALFTIGDEVLLSIDDIQWCDDETLNWMHALLVSPQSSHKLLIAGTQRTGEALTHTALRVLLATLRQGGFLAERVLDRLSLADTVLLAEAIGGQVVDEPFAEQLYAVTEGNPLFVVESMRAAGAGMLPFADQTDTLTVNDPIDENETAFLAALPDRVLALLRARLERLSPSSRRVAGLAAVIGREFSLDVLKSAATIENTMDEATLVDGLDELWWREIVHEEEPATYDFSHGLLREAAIAELSTASRRLFHRHVAIALENVHAANLDAVNAQIATHYDRAGLVEPSVRYYRQAAVSAESIYAHDSAIRFLRRALDLQVMSPTFRSRAEQSLRTQLLESLGDILDFVGRHEEARTAFRQALAHVTEYEAIKHAQLFRKIGKTHEGQRDYEGALAAYTEADALLRQRPTKAISAWWQAWIQIQLERLWVYYWTNDWKQSAALVEQLQPSMHQFGSHPQQISFYLVRGSTAMLHSRYQVTDETLHLTQVALDLAETAGERGQIAWARFVHGFGLLWHGDLQEAQAQISAALRVAEETGDLVHQARCNTYLAIIQRFYGDVEKVRSYAQAADAAAEMVQMVEYMATAAANLGWLAWREKDDVAATSQLERAVALWQQLPAGHPSTAFRWTAHLPLLAIALTEDRLHHAVDYASNLIQPNCQRLPKSLTEFLVSAEVAWRSGQERVAQSRLSSAVREAEALGYL